MKIEMWGIGRVAPYAQNPRLNEKAVDKVAASIREFGFRQPLVVDPQGILIVGHTRWEAAKRLGLTDVPVHVAEDLTPDQVRAYRIADNQLATIAEWDEQLLQIELQELQAAGYDTGLLGFSDGQLSELLAGGNAGLCDPDEVPEPPDQAMTRPGDLWILGQHRLLCGDSSQPADVDRLLAGLPIHLVNMDPPYNVRVEPRSNNAIAAGNSSFGLTHHQKLDASRRGEVKRTTKKMRAKDRQLANDFLPAAEFEALLRAWFCNASRVLLPGRGFYVWGGYANVANYPPALKEAELYFSQAIIWHKLHPVLTRKDFMGDHEWCFYGWREGAAHKYFGPHNATDVWEISPITAGGCPVGIGRGLRLESETGSRIDVTPPAAADLPTVRVSEQGLTLVGLSEASDVWQVKKVPGQKMVHLTEKPVELAVRAMQYSSLAGEHVLDLFGGSGSTLIAAEQTGRRAFLMELDPPYCDVIVERFEKFTGQKAERLAPGALIKKVSA
jgi:DNA modification methylase